MIRINAVAMVAVASLITAAANLPAQQASQTPARPPAPNTYEEYIVSVWKGVHNKILVMAKDFPEDKYSWRPHPDSRSVLDEFRHVTIGLEMSAAQLRGEPFDYAGRLKADESKPTTRESVVKDMEAALSASYALVESKPKPQLVWWIDHQGEHYGKLVSNYRMNGLVPPISRPRQ
ncbi:MAG: DinB family protein [Longimicrobiales bacterium]